MTEGGVLELEVPRDRNAEFAPVLIPKYNGLKKLDKKRVRLSW